MPELATRQRASRTLTLIKAVHTAVWAVFASFILAIPVLACYNQHHAAAWLAAAVAGEVMVLVLNRMKCPLTALAARYSDDRRANFDIYLPEWLARHNQIIFGSLYCAGLAFALAHWALSPG